MAKFKQVVDTSTGEVVQVKPLATWLTYQPKEEHNETPTGVSLTVPEQLPNIRLMLNRAAINRALPIRSDSTYSEEDYPDFEKMDRMELAMYRRELIQNIERYREELVESSRTLFEKDQAAEKAANIEKQQASQESA